MRANETLPLPGAHARADDNCELRREGLLLWEMTTTKRSGRGRDIPKLSSTRSTDALDRTMTTVFHECPFKSDRFVPFKR